MSNQDREDSDVSVDFLNFGVGGVSDDTDVVCDFLNWDVVEHVSETGDGLVEANGASECHVMVRDHVDVEEPRPKKRRTRVEQAARAREIRTHKIYKTNIAALREELRTCLGEMNDSNLRKGQRFSSIGRLGAGKGGVGQGIIVKVRYGKRTDSRHFTSSGLLDIAYSKNASLGCLADTYRCHPKTAGVAKVIVAEVSMMLQKAALRMMPLAVPDGGLRYSIRSLRFDETEHTLSVKHFQDLTQEQQHVRKT